MRKSIIITGVSLAIAGAAVMIPASPAEAPSHNIQVTQVAGSRYEECGKYTFPVPCVTFAGDASVVYTPRETLVMTETSARLYYLGEYIR